MADYTKNYNFEKPTQDEFYNVDVTRDNMDAVDTELKRVEDKIDNIQVPVTSVNNKTGAVTLTAADVGAETPAGAQAKVDTHAGTSASTAAKGHVQLNNTVTSTSTTQAATANAVKTAYDRAEAAFQSASDGKNEVATAITGMGQTASGSDTFATLANKIKAISTDATAIANHLLSGITAYSKGSKITGEMPNRGAVAITPSTADQVIRYGYHNGLGYVKGDTNLKAENIKSGVRIFDTLGTLATVKSVQSGVITEGGSTVRAQISPVNINNCVVIVSQKATGYYSAENHVKGSVIVDGSSYYVELIKYASNGTPSYYFQVIEFNSIKSLQKGTYTMTGSQQTITIGAVNVNKSIVICQWTSNLSNSRELQYYELGYMLSNSTTLLLDRTSNGIFYVDWYVIEFD